MSKSGPAGADETAAKGDRRASGPEISHFLLQTCHDLRASLRGIRVHAELLVKEREVGETPNFAQHLSVIVADTGRLEQLANGLAGYSIACQIDKGSFVLAPMDVMLRGELVRVGQELRENGAEVTYDDMPRIHCDPDRLQQLFEGLLRNALLHRGAAAPRIHISAEKQGETWLFGVRDNGPGIESAYLERIFEPFERLRGRQAPGPGLGLTICRAIVEKHGGRMWAKSEPGKGATFFFTLPGEPS
jgi:signal transduction histidine kinase